MAEKQIPLETWAARHYDPPPSIRTLRAWAKSGRIHPEPQMVGREYRVIESATYIPPARPVRLAPVTVLHSKDIIVNEIINRGKTSQPRQARPAR